MPDVWAANRNRNASEPVRLKLSFMAARIAAEAKALAALPSADLGKPESGAAKRKASG